MKKTFDVILEREIMITQTKKIRVNAYNEDEAQDIAFRRTNMNEGAKHPIRWKRGWKTKEADLETITTNFVEIKK